jgi:hypothetical protein
MSELVELSEADYAVPLDLPRINAALKAYESLSGPMEIARLSLFSNGGAHLSTMQGDMSEHFTTVSQALEFMEGAAAGMSVQSAMNNPA